MKELHDAAIGTFPVSLQLQRHALLLLLLGGQYCSALHKDSTILYCAFVLPAGHGHPPPIIFFRSIEWTGRQADRHRRAAMIRVSAAMMGRRPLGKDPLYDGPDRDHTIWARLDTAEREAARLCVVLVPCMHVPCLCLSAAPLVAPANPFIPPSVRVHSSTPSIHACTLSTCYLLPAAGDGRSSDQFHLHGSALLRFDFASCPFLISN
jgi:hypothetical protein